MPPGIIGKTGGNIEILNSPMPPGEVRRLSRIGNVRLILTDVGPCPHREQEVAHPIDPISAAPIRSSSTLAVELIYNDAAARRADAPDSVAVTDHVDPGVGKR